MIPTAPPSSGDIDAARAVIIAPTGAMKVVMIRAVTEAEGPARPRKKKTLLIVLAVVAVAVVGLTATLIVRKQ